MTYDDPNLGVPHTIQVSLAGSSFNPSAASLVFATSVIDFERGPLNQTKQITVNLHNYGNTDVDDITAPSLSNGFAYAGGVVFPGNGGDCDPSAGLGAGDFCKVVIEYTPTVSNQLNVFNLSLDYNLGSKSTSLILVGEGDDYAFISNFLTFDEIAYPGTGTKTIAFLNRTSGTITEMLAHPLMSHSDKYAVTANCGISGLVTDTVVAYGTCVFTIIFTPPNSTSDLDDILTISFKANGMTHYRHLFIYGSSVNQL